MNDLAKLKKDTAAFLARVRANGGGDQLFEGQCPSCKGSMHFRIPPKGAGIWDSAKVCVECGDMAFHVSTNKRISLWTFEGYSNQEKPVTVYNLTKPTEPCELH